MPLPTYSPFHSTPQPLNLEKTFGTHAQQYRHASLRSMQHLTKLEVGEVRVDIERGVFKHWSGSGGLAYCVQGG